MKYVRKGNIIRGRLEKGEEIITTLTAFCHDQQICSGKISAIGAARNLTLGYYDLHEKKYFNTDFEDDYEITGINGNISLLNGAPYLHIHITIADHLCRSFGGHLFSGTVSITCEFYIEVTEPAISRAHDPETGLNLLDF